MPVSRLKGTCPLLTMQWSQLRCPTRQQHKFRIISFTAVARRSWSRKLDYVVYYCTWSCTAALYMSTNISSAAAAAGGASQKWKVHRAARFKFVQKRYGACLCLWHTYNMRPPFRLPPKTRRNYDAAKLLCVEIKLNRAR